MREIALEFIKEPSKYGLASQFSHRGYQKHNGIYIYLLISPVSACHVMFIHSTQTLVSVLGTIMNSCICSFTDPDQSPDVDINTPSSAPVQPAMPERQPDNKTSPAIAHSATDSVPTSTRQHDRAGEMRKNVQCI